MFPSERIELAIFHHINQVGSARQTSLSALFNSLNPTTGTGPLFQEIMNTLRALRNKGKITLWKYSGDVRVSFDQYVGFEGTQNDFFGGSFGVEIVPEEIRYFEELEERTRRETHSQQSPQQMHEESEINSAPTELHEIPGKPHLLAYLQKKLDAQELIAVLFIDLDGFKDVNDQLGHEEGDDCLKRVVEIIDKAIIGKGKLYRPGGDEFVAALPNFTRHEAAATAERIRAMIDDCSPGGKCKVTTSIGVTDSKSKAATDAKTLVSLADAAKAPIYGETDNLHIGTRVHVLEPIPGQPRENWAYTSMIWVIREVNKVKNTATATPVLPPLQGPTPTVEGPMSGPNSPFKRTNIPS